MAWKRKDLLSMQDLDAAEIGDLLDTAETMKEIADLRGVEVLHAEEVLALPRHRLVLRLADHDAIDPIVLAEHDGHDLPAARGQVLADIVGADGQLAMAAVDENGQADDARAAEVHQGVHGGADRPAREEHVVDEDHDATLHGEVDLGAAHLRLLDL